MADPADFSKTRNPFDFANPVSDADVFAGRKAELRDIRYYLDHTARAEHPINLAILGPRASGKTSLLNMCELEAIQRDLCAVRIELDEGDSTNQMAFFLKLMDGIMTTACDSGAFGI